MDRLLVDLEAQLYNYETFYLEKYTAATGGNLIKGLDPALFMAAIPPLAQGSSPVLDEDRIFSNSSLTTHKALQIKAKNAPPLSSASAFVAASGARSLAPTFAAGSARRRISAATAASGRRKKHGHATLSARKALRGTPSSRGHARRSVTTHVLQVDDSYQRDDNGNDGECTVRTLEQDPDPYEDNGNEEEVYQDQRASKSRKKRRVVRLRPVQDND